jgi:hypothetical protein
MPGVHGERGIGIAFKISDGDSAHFGDDLESRTRVRPAASLEILRQLKALNDSQLQSLAKFGPTRELRNYAGLLTGKSRTVFVLK